MSKVPYRIAPIFRLLLSLLQVPMLASEAMEATMMVLVLEAVMEVMGIVTVHICIFHLTEHLN